MVETTDNTREAQQLTPGEEQVFTWHACDKDSAPIRFYFEVEDPCLVRVVTWQIEGETTPTLYIDTQDSEVRAKKN